MASEVVAPGVSTKRRHQSQNAPHGTKRAAENGLESEQRLSKRFDLLNLIDNNGTRLYIPVSGSSDTALPASKPLPKPVAPVVERKRKEKARPPPPDDCMQVEDTPHRVYIHDLSAELSDVESDEENPIFLSDIEKHLSKIPKHILTGPEPKQTANNQMVLYNIPSSLTVPEDQDNVRKAIVEARARVRERQANTIGEPERANAVNGTSKASNMVPGESGKYAVMDMEDPDAMEIDDI
ncbi:hypothetical protein K469DRAFT_108820 [Zopfia rhizophila CBS 207.26]|uniref:Uncharacterized protein n=1 Tax=Zopfia rhizophila CBS 207.26 TaxID=1314779 RepID=A0A6A6EAN7_9PEZI|nr:hypothetical protein K469DRAFT_108820 [Zopfia rhizophila CBS 207.26]